MMRHFKTTLPGKQKSRTSLHRDAAASFSTMTRSRTKAKGVSWPALVLNATASLVSRTVFPSNPAPSAKPRALMSTVLLAGDRVRFGFAARAGRLDR